ncbi:protein-disulfide reductase DsbD domain-containing protein [Roseovarius nubinhibens]|uniref:Thiol:disulfide interchange protein DsbD N-terminal domain-containing protein n=1 Tax=Roseovarius nubinhibens TaxID=314263 RepID=A0A348WC21_9RHOB|nr:hypothetical protein [Roseovarius nubinhibens]|tara:strand:- start:1208 stop:2005 length:798 start_codon:yes stop_codon:yes gene_type:complete
MIIRLLSLLLALAASPLSAQSGEVISARILPGWRLADGSHMAGIEFTLAPGWKTYWRAPGDAGIPPQFDWRGSANLAGVEVLWPRPRIIDQAGLKSIGYKEKVTLPLHVKPRNSGGDVTLRGVVDLGVCEDICIPAQVEVSGLLDRATIRPDPRVAAALAAQPLTAREAGLTHVSCQITPAKDGMSITARLTLPTTGGTETVVMEAGNPLIWVAPAKASRQGQSLTVQSYMTHVEGRPFAIDRSALRLTVLGASKAVDIQGCPAP